ncbi:MAG TPA: hypothetical protein VGM54_23340 [Chthoniobacter sp.]|jgi:hypothetical protein
MPRSLDRSRTLVLDWLRLEHRDPSFLASAVNLENRHGEIAQEFLKWADDSGFAYEIVKVDGIDGPAYEIHWTHRGASFVGFKQPPPERTPDDALLAGCAALLENDWCRERLPA